MADNNARSIGISLDDLEKLGHGTHRLYKEPSQRPYDESRSNAMTNNVFGLNIRQTPLAVPMNKDRYGYTFFTRPQLNMQRVNLQASRLFYPLMTDVQTSYLRMARCLLDPRIMRGYSATAGGASESDLDTQALLCPLVDKYNPFFAVLSNSLTAISGWPDLEVPVFTGRAGPYKEEWSIADGATINYSAYNITATFRNSRGDPISTIMGFWERYMSYVFEGVLSPYPDFIVENEIDYQTRIYRLVMDPSNRVVTRMAACGAAFPINYPTGAVFDFDSSKPYNDANAEISVSFRCMGFIENDDILIKSFNWVQGVFNPGMQWKNPRTMMPDTSVMTHIPHHLTGLFENRAYPRIDPKSRELQWWTHTQYYNDKMAAFKTLDSQLDNALGLNLMTA